MTRISQRLEHRYTSKRLSAYVDDQLSARERERVEEHLRRCAECRAEVRTLRWTKSLLRKAPTVPLPHSFVIREADIAPRQSPVMRMLPAMRWATALVAIMFIAVLIGDVLTGQMVAHVYRSNISPPKGELAETVVVKEISTTTPVVRAVATSEGKPRVMGRPSPTAEAEVLAVPSSTSAPRLRGSRTTVKAAPSPTPQPEVREKGVQPPAGSPTPAPEITSPATTDNAYPPSPLPTTTPCSFRQGDHNVELLCTEPSPGRVETPLHALPRLGWRVAEGTLGLTLIALMVILVWARVRR